MASAKQRAYAVYFLCRSTVLSEQHLENAFSSAQDTSRQLTDQRAFLHDGCACADHVVTADETSDDAVSPTTAHSLMASDISSVVAALPSMKADAPLEI